ncbi:MAG: FtsX-like permease family protein, partial [Bacteroidota bacterium]
ILHQYQQYRRPVGFEYENVWTINFNALNAADSSLFKIKDQLLNRISNFPEVEVAGISESSIIFTGGTYRNTMTYKEKRVGSDHLVLGNQDAEIMDIPLLQGRWFNETDEVGKETAIVINQHFKNEMFGDENPLGKVIYIDKDDPTTFKRVVGVIGDFKYKGDFQEPWNLYFNQKDKNSQYYDILLKVSPDASAEFEATLSKTVAQIAKGWQIEIGKMAEKKAFLNKFTYIPTIILLIVCSFLIFNVLLGLFGILWYNINQRKGEIGLRRAMGATQEKIAWQFIGEVIVIATFALIIGVFFAVQFPLLGVFSFFGVSSMTYILAIVLAILLIYGIIIFCAFYPSHQAAKIHPAVALHAD